MKTVCAFLLLAVCAAALGAVPIPEHFTVERELLDVNGRLNFVIGEFGRVEDPSNMHSVLTYLHEYVYEMAGLEGSEVFVLKRNSTDFRHNIHLHFQLFFVRDDALLEVDGGELALHMYPDGRVFAINAYVVPEDVTDPAYGERRFVLSPHEAFERALASFEQAAIEEEPSRVVFLMDGSARHAYRAVAEYMSEGGDLVRSKMYACPFQGTLISELPLHHPAGQYINRTIYNANNKMRLPGSEVRTERENPVVGDPQVNQAYDNSGACYKFYLVNFRRNSYDGKGADMLSTVHYREAYNNAFWNGQQMVYGDGDGVNFEDFAQDLSVVCHELTHAVVEYTAGLRYRNESGALNEGWADIMGASSVIMMEGALQPDSWEIGSECYLAGDALRYMNNPVLDGASRDYYPDRYTGILDNGGVHWNSGIANLFYVLFTQGGVHPQQKTTNYVEGVGIAVSQQVVYSALNNYMMQDSSFANAAAACEAATKALYPDNSKYMQSVVGAWAAVGVSPSS
eukprot:TRINITY_DN1326_c0_g1_i1.p1 TRINITY_DN1326_c0_g1~~TRINITY_DN1326_c0_g1_i1.p1  ORF type:complete len:535 (-),score=203.25 TRINITY_DN1326_c0_g1_i1:59-1594(-)